MAGSNLRILGRKWVLMLRKRVNGNAGECDYAAATIKVASYQDVHERKDAVLHELMHAILYQQGRPYGGEVEESYVGPLATGLIAAFQDNPRLAAWLIAKH